MSYLTQMLGARCAELRLGRGRHGGRRRLHPRPHAPLVARARQLLGRPHAQLPLRAAADLRSSARCVLVSQGVVQNLDAPDPGQDARGRRADDRPGPGRLAGDHQGARHQRRRLLQRQLGAPVREPDAAHQPPRDAGDPRHPGRRFTYMFGQFAGEPAAGLGALRRRDGRCSCSSVASMYCERAGRQPQSDAGPAPTRRRRRRSPAATWRARRSASASRAPPSGQRPRPHLVRRRQHGARQPHAARRRHGDAQHRARRGRLRRRRRRAHGHAGLRHPRGVHRRPDGRPHARVPGQEDRGPTR